MHPITERVALLKSVGQCPTGTTSLCRVRGWDRDDLHASTFRLAVQVDHSPSLAAGECWVDAAHASEPRGTVPSASHVVIGALGVGSAPQAYIAVGPPVYPAGNHTGGRGRAFHPQP